MPTLKEFLAEKKSSPLIQYQSTGSLSDFLKSKGKTVQKQTEIQDTNNLGSFLSKNNVSIAIPKKEEKKEGLWNWIGKQITKPVGVSAKEFRGVGEAIGNLMSIASPRVSAEKGIKEAAKSLLNAQRGAWNVVSGVETTNFLKEMKDAGIEPDLLDKTMALGADLILDPLNFFAPIKAVKGIGKITKLEKPISKIADIVKQAPVSQKLKTLFSTTTGNKEFDTILRKFRNLKEFREGSLIEDAVKIQKDIKNFKKSGIKNVEEIITEGLENPIFRATIKDEKVLNLVNNLQRTYKDFLNVSKKVGLKIGEVMEYAPRIRTKESFISTLKKEVGLGTREWGKGSIEKGRKAFINMTQKEIRELGDKYTNFFEKNPAIALAKKGQAYVKAITSQEFAKTVEKFAVKGGQVVTHPALKGKTFEPTIARAIDNYYKGIQPEELKVIIKTFDKVQNIWKAQALISPSYHIRNTAGNIWNNFLAGVNPAYYGKAALVQRGALKAPELIKEMKQLGVINEGWYAKDIGEEVIKRVEGIGNWKSTLNPLSQENALFRLNKRAGTTVENNARIAHYLHMREVKKLSPEKAAESVKKYLFDYGDLTDFEKNVMKRVFPFWTWSKKNLPLQLEGIMTQPGKYALPHKIIENLESGIEQPNEKYMSSYIRENIPVRVRKNKDGDTEYFLLGNWLPYASAIDILSKPINTVVEMATPLLKVPIELWTNKSTFWKDSLGRYEEIERGGLEYGEFLGQLIRKRNIHLLKNIRILNDLNKWIDKKDPTATKDSWAVKALNTFFGKTATYDESKSKYFYDRDTEDYIADMKKAIKTAQVKGYEQKASDLQRELNEVLRIRRGE